MAKACSRVKAPRAYTPGFGGLNGCKSEAIREARPWPVSFENSCLLSNKPGGLVGDNNAAGVVGVGAAVTGRVVAG